MVAALCPESDAQKLLFGKIKGILWGRMAAQQRLWLFMSSKRKQIEEELQLGRIFYDIEMPQIGGSV